MTSKAPALILLSSAMDDAGILETATTLIKLFIKICINSLIVPKRRVRTGKNKMAHLDRTIFYLNFLKILGFTIFTSKVDSVIEEFHFLTVVSHSDGVSILQVYTVHLAPGESS